MPVDFPCQHRVLAGKFLPGPGSQGLLIRLYCATSPQACLYGNPAGSPAMLSSKPRQVRKEATVVVMRVPGSGWQGGLHAVPPVFSDLVLPVPGGSCPFTFLTHRHAALSWAGRY